MGRQVLTKQVWTARVGVRSGRAGAGGRRLRGHTKESQNAGLAGSAMV
jgi:hypothetical protein